MKLTIQFQILLKFNEFTEIECFRKSGFSHVIQFNSNNNNNIYKL